MIPYYAEGRATIWHGEALDVLRTMADESVDIVVTSPPYNMGLTPGGNGRGMYPHRTQKARRFGDGYDEAGDDAMDPDEYAGLRRAELAEMWRVSRLGVFWNHRPRVIHGLLRDPLDGDYGLPLRQRIILARPTGIDVNPNQFCTRGEYLLLFAKPAFRLVDRSASGMGDVWSVSIAHHPEHPAPFDVSIPARCIRATAATSVLDPFAGTGTTLLAAAQAGVVGIGVERSEQFCRAAAERLGAFIPAADCLFGSAATGTEGANP